MDVVIPFRRSPNRDLELMYALRSLELYIPGIDNIYIVGDSPRWAYRHLIILPKDESSHQDMRENNIAMKLWLSASMERLSTEFIHTDDDIFLLRNFVPKFYHRGQDWDGTGFYSLTERNTRELFPGTNNFNVHYPKLYNKYKLIDTFLTYTKPQFIKYGYQIPAAYCALHSIESEYTTEVKFKYGNFYEGIKFQIKDRGWFSISDSGFKQSTLKVLEELYPNKSKYEAR